MERLLIQKIMLFSDSQSAVGILTLGWENKTHKAVILEIKQTMDIQKSQNVQIELNWTPGHADVASNEIADKLAKEVAEESENMPEMETPLTSIVIKKAVKDSCKMKWQKRWDVSQTCLISNHQLQLERKPEEASQHSELKLNLERDTATSMDICTL